MRGKLAALAALTTGVVLVGGLSAAVPAADQRQFPGAAGPGLPETIRGGVIVDLADGDRFKVTTSRDLLTVWGSRYDAATRTWGGRQAIVRKKNLYCGDIDARAAGDAVAVIAMCDEGGYSEDTAPADSQALYSPDTTTWHATTLPGEGHEEPGISPSGNRAVWPLHESWVTWNGTGFDLEQRELPGQEYTVTATISDAGDVSVLYGAYQQSLRDCGLGIVTVTAAGVATRQELALEGACSEEADLTNLDALTVLAGWLSHPESVNTVTRPDTASPWTVNPAPEDAPGLVKHRGRKAAATRFVASPGLPLLAVGSADRRLFIAQTYDPAARRWSEPARIDTSDATCSWSRRHDGDPLGVVALGLDCGKHQRVLVTTDAQGWRDVRLGRSPLGVAPDGDQVSVSNRRRTLIFSREAGLVRLPLGTSGRCDVVQPVSPTSALRLTTSRAAGWPSVLQKSTPTGWRRTSSPVARSRAGTDRCRTAEVDLFDESVSYRFRGKEHSVWLTLTARGDGWRVRNGYY